MNSSAGSDQTTAYAKAVVAGLVVSGELAIAACKRHLDDLKKGAKRGLLWDVEAAEKVIRFFPAMFTITAGAKAGEPFNLLPWHVFVVGSIFGWKKAESGRLRFRSIWLETGKGQAKSPLMGGIGVYMMGWHGIPRSEVYAIGWEKRTANVLFTDAVAMCKSQIQDQDEGISLESLGEVVVRGVLSNAWKIEHPDSKSFFQALANTDAVSGPRPSCVAADEIHEFKDDSPIVLWRQAIAKQPGDAFMMLGTNTPASTQIVATNMSERYQKIAKQELDDDESFSFIARVDKTDVEDVFDNPDCWPKALPALGITFPLENMMGAVETARTSMSDSMSVKRLYFGIPTGAVSFWIAEEAWMSVLDKVDETKYKKKKCWLSLDLSQKNDLTALTAGWEDDELKKLVLKSWYWTVKDGIEARQRADNAPYERWVHEKYLTAVPGAVIDKTFVAMKVMEMCTIYDVQFLAFDVAGLSDFIAACEVIGFPVWKYEGPDKPEGKGLKLIPHAQGNRRLFEEKQLTMPTSIEKFEDAILNKRVIIDNSPVTYMCAANAYILPDAQGNRCFDKKRSRGRIDGIVTNAMTAGAALADFKKKVKKPQLLIL